MQKTSALLKRFAAQIADTPFPKAISDLSVQQQMRLAKADPELFAVMNGSATASLEASVLDGTFADTYEAPSDDQINAEEVAQLIAEGAFPTAGTYREDGSYQEPTEGNFTSQMRIAQLDPARYQAELEKIQASAPALSPQAVDDSQTRINSLNASRGMN